MTSNKAWLFAAAALILSVTLSGCQTIGYQSIKNNVRMATTYESDKKVKVVGKRIEMQPVGSNYWYEAEKTASGAYALTPLGSANKQSDESIPDGGGGGGGGGCN
jgi:hypothetical protein